MEVLEEKKLTDEEIVKALECCINECDCENSPYGNKNDCMANVEEILDLIHRLQGENKRLKSTKYRASWKAKFFKAQAEIERLTEEKYQVEQNLKQCENGYELELHTARYDMRVNREKVAELQKKVDELKLFEEKYNDLAKKYMADTKTADYIRHRAVKDTAKEVFQMVEENYKGFESDMDNLIYALHERYGVEVE